MRNFGCTGHVIALTELVKVMSPEARESILENLDMIPNDERCENINDNLPPTYPRIEEAFYLDDEDESEDLERGVWYVYFATEDLYEQKKTAGMIALEAAGITPERRNWVVWG